MRGRGGARRGWWLAVGLAWLGAGCLPAGGGGGSGPRDLGGVFDGLPPPPDERLKDAGLDAGRDAGLDAGADGALDAAPAPDRGPPPPPAFGIATFNVQRFFDRTCDSGRCGEGDFEFVPSVQSFERRAEDLARGIIRLHREHGADVVALQEVESQASLDRLRFYLDQLDNPFEVALIGETGFEASLDVALLARGRRLRVVTHRERPLTRPDGSRTTFSRELLEVHLEARPLSDPAAAPQRIIVFVAHYRSKNNDDPGRREAEARATRAIMLEVIAAHPQALVVLAGDLNDTPGSPTLAALEAGGQLVRVAAELGEAAATYRYNGAGSAIDHVYHGVRAACTYQPGSAAVVRSPGQDGLAGSDHAALVARFDCP